MEASPEKVISLALSQEGYLEKASNAQLDDFKANAGNKNFTKFARDLDAIPGFYNGRKNGFPWCDVFVDWLFVQAFGAENAKKLLCQPGKSLGAGCGYSARYYKANGQFHTKDPKPGDQVFFLDSAGDVAHTGLVYKVDNLYSRECDRGIRFNDPAIGVDWGEVTESLLSQKDTTAPLLEDSDCNFVYGEI